MNVTLNVTLKVTVTLTVTLTVPVTLTSGADAVLLPDISLEIPSYWQENAEKRVWASSSSSHVMMAVSAYGVKS